jgi:RND family efflux transporter MFP subunit
MISSIIKWTLAGLLVGVVPAIFAADIPKLETAGAELRQLPRQFRLDGTVEAVNRATVSAQTSGQVQEILYDVDDYVEKGTLLVVLKDTEHQAHVGRATADLKAALAQRQEAEDEYKRTKEMFVKKLVAESVMDKASTALKSTRSRFDAAQANLAQAQEQLEYTRIRAPFAGIVTERQLQLGETAQPGHRVMSGISLEQLRVSVDVPQSVVPLVREFGQAQVQYQNGDWVVAQKITVYPIADQGSNTFKVRLWLPEGTAKLFPGMFVKTSFVTGFKEDLVVPVQAVVYRSEVTGVYVVEEDGRVRFRHIRAGQRSADGQVLVLAGLMPGERVALDPVAAGVELKRQRAEVRKEQGHE